MMKIKIPFFTGGEKKIEHVEKEIRHRKSTIRIPAYRGHTKVGEFSISELAEREHVPYMTMFMRYNVERKMGKRSTVKSLTAPRHAGRNS